MTTLFFFVAYIVFKSKESYMSLNIGEFSMLHSRAIVNFAHIKEHFHGDYKGTVGDLFESIALVVALNVKVLEIGDLNVVFEDARAQQAYEHFFSRSVNGFDVVGEFFTNITRVKASYFTDITLNLDSVLKDMFKPNMINVVSIFIDPLYRINLVIKNLQPIVVRRPDGSPCLIDPANGEGLPRDLSRLSDSLSVGFSKHVSA